MQAKVRLYGDFNLNAKYSFGKSPFVLFHGRVVPLKKVFIRQSAACLALESTCLCLCTNAKKENASIVWVGKGIGNACKKAPLFGILFR